MAKSSSEPFEVGCPCCNAVLKVDPDTKAVLSHVAAVKPKMFNDFEAAAKAMPAFADAAPDRQPDAE